MIKIITDSASDITQAEAKELGISIVPMKVTIGDKIYTDGIDITNEEFFEKLIESDDLPKTSQLTPNDWKIEFDKVDKNDHAIVITLSKDLSGSYQNAYLLSQEYDNIHVIDSKNVTIGERLLIKRALKLIEEGHDVEYIVNKLEEEKKEIRLIALLDTLEYLRKGGRISKTTAFFGEMLSIKPVVEIIDGKVVSTGKARGSKNGNNKLREAIDKYDGIDFARPYALAYSGLSDVLINKYINDSKDLYGNHKLTYSLIGSTIGTHIGPNGIAVAFFKNHKD